MSTTESRDLGNRIFLAAQAVADAGNNLYYARQAEAKACSERNRYQELFFQARGVLENLIAEADKSSEVP